MATSSRGFVTATPYNGARLAATYNFTNVTNNNTITDTFINSIRDAYALECVRRNLNSPAAPATDGDTIRASHINSLKNSIEISSTLSLPAITTSVTAAAAGSDIRGRGDQIFDAMFPAGTEFVPNGVDAWQGVGRPNPRVGNPPAFSVPAYTTGGGTHVAENTITASGINALITKVKDAGAVCLCNCNYCTCNCNYCTCNCNYACTCNCNYSDRRLKTLIKLLRSVEEINVYSFSYLWDTTKTYIGVLAQELLGTKYESALTKDSVGYYVVDYSKLPIKMLKV